MFEAPDDPFESPPSSAKPSFPSFSSSTPPLHPLSPSTPPALTPHSSPFTNITCRDTLTTSRVINTADLIPYDIPIDHEDGRPPPTHNFLYDDPDSAREGGGGGEDSDEEDGEEGLGVGREGGGMGLSPVHGPSSHASPGHGHGGHHHILVVDTKVDRGEEKDMFRASPGSRSASASFSSPSPSSASLYMSPKGRRPSLSPRSPSTPRSVQALVDRITMLEQTNVMLLKETMELRRELDGSREKVREMGKKVAVLEEREKGGAPVKERKAPVDLPPVTISAPTIISPSPTSSSSSSHFSARLAAVTASSVGGSAASPTSSTLSARGPQLAPLFTATRGSSVSTASTSSTSPRHLTPAASHLTTPSPSLSPSYSSHAEGSRDKAHSLSDHPLSAPSRTLFSYPSSTHSPSPSSSPLSSRPASASSPVTLSPVSSFYSPQPPPANSSSPSLPVKAQLLRASLSRGTKPTSNAANLDGSSMNVGNALSDKPSIRLFPHYATGDAMKTLLTDEGMGLRYDGERK